MINQHSKGINVALWVVQALLALAFGMAGFMKATVPLADLAKNMTWVSDVPGLLVRFIGISEFAGALGMLLPSLTRIWPALTPLAGVGLTTVMVLATGFHLLKGEILAIGAPIILGCLAAFVAWGRFRKAPIALRA